MLKFILVEQIKLERSSVQADYTIRHALSLVPLVISLLTLETGWNFDSGAGSQSERERERPPARGTHNDDAMSSVDVLRRAADLPSFLPSFLLKFLPSSQE